MNNDALLKDLDSRITKAKAQRNSFEERAAKGALPDNDKAELASVKSDLTDLQNRRNNVLEQIVNEKREAEARSRFGADPAGYESGESRNTPDLVDMIEQRSSSAVLERRSLLASAATAGKETIQTRVRSNFYETLDQFSGVWRVAGKLETGLDESPVKLPIVSDFGRGDQELPEGDQITDDDGVIESAIFNAFRYTGLQTISNTLINSSVVDTGMLVSSMLAKRIVREYRERLTIGTGVNQPQGLTVGAGAGPTAAAPDSIDLDELMDVVHAVGPEYRDTRMSSWVMHDSTWQHVRKIKDNEGRYLVGDLSNGAEMRLHGYPVIIDQAMPVMVAGERAIVFGAIEDAYMIRHTAIRVDRSSDFLFDHDEMAYRIVLALDAKVIDPSAIVALEMGA